jgi:hypothetical protein
MRINPCKDCADRHPACHSHCEKYKEWKVEWDALREKERRRKEQEEIGWRSIYPPKRKY